MLALAVWHRARRKERDNKKRLILSIEVEQSSQTIDQSEEHLRIVIKICDGLARPDLPDGASTESCLGERETHGISQGTKKQIRLVDRVD